jgi:site-specific DNA recombinase
MITAALYARVSSEKQAQSNTIASQLADIEKRIHADGYHLLNEFKYIDNGYSGSYLDRPALEKLRDKVYEGALNKIYIHSPDRLSRKYAHQMVLLEEFQHYGSEVIFLNCQTENNPESQLLLQMQGMIAEYERTKILERNRRGRIHAAKNGSVGVLGKAPYGYRYISKHIGSGVARLEVFEEEAEIVRKIFRMIGRDRLSIREVCRRLNRLSPVINADKKVWSASTMLGILKNPAYKGQAAYGKTKVGKRLPKVRPQKNSSEQPKRNHSIYPVEKDEWIYIPVPQILDETLFDLVQEQLEENRKTARVQKDGVTYLLQGLLVCKHCQYAFYGKSMTKHVDKKDDNYGYYRCSGTDASRFGGTKICNNAQMRTDRLEIIVWEEVKCLLKHPQRILYEYQRRIAKLEKSPAEQTEKLFEKQKASLQRGISRLIDSYAEGHVDKDEFGPRITSMKQRLKIIEEQNNNQINQENLKTELQLVITNLECFQSCVQEKMNEVDWQVKRDIIRTLIRRIEISETDINIVFKINELSHKMDNERSNKQHCTASLSSRAR